MRVRDSRFVICAGMLLASMVYGGRPQAVAHDDPAAYHVVYLSSLGGTNSRGNSINDIGLVAGYSSLPGNKTRHATAWLDGLRFDLGTLGGPNSSVAWPLKNTIGTIAGISQTDVPEPLGEAWSCSAFFPPSTATGKTCLGFVMEFGVMRPLPTLGGNNGFATGVNNRSEVVGWAENTVHDDTCVPPQILQFRPVVWGPGVNHIRQLPLLPGDSSGAATALNDQDQVVGISGICDQAVGRLTAAHAVLWDHGTLTNIGDLGAKYWNTPMAINQRGVIVGFMGQPGDFDGNRLRAFRWSRRDGLRDLGTLPIPTHVFSSANGINERGQIVGTSCDADFIDCRAFLWEDGVMTDVNDRRSPTSADILINGQDINDSGVITGRARRSTGERSGYVAIPTREGDVR